LFERAKAAKGKNREGGPGRNFRQEIYAGQVSLNEFLFLVGERTNCLVRVRDLKPGAMFLFERARKPQKASHTGKRKRQQSSTAARQRGSFLYASMALFRRACTSSNLYNPSALGVSPCN